MTKIFFTHIYLNAADWNSCEMPGWVKDLYPEYGAKGSPRNAGKYLKYLNRPLKIFQPGKNIYSYAMMFCSVAMLRRLAAWKSSSSSQPGCFSCSSKARTLCQR